MKRAYQVHFYFAFLAVTMLAAASLACNAPILVGQQARQGSSMIPTFTAVVIANPGAANPDAALPNTGQTLPAAPVGQATQTPAAPVAPEPTDDPSRPHYLGDTTRSDGYALTAHAVADPAKPGVLYQPRQGTRLVAVEVTVANISRDSLSVNPLNTVLLDANGNQYPLSLAAVSNQLNTIILKKGEKARGWVAFQIPQDAKPAAVEYGAGLLSLNLLRASLIPPPEGYQPGDSSPASTPAADSAAPLTYLGDAVEKDGVAIVPISVKDPAQPSQFYQAKTDKKLVAVEMVVANVNSDTLQVNPLNAVLVDAQGLTYKAELGGVDHQLPILSLFPGEHVQGWVAFETPINAAAVSIKYTLQTFGEVSIKAGLATAPYGRASILLPGSPPPPALPKLGERVEKFGFALTASAVKDPAEPGMLYQSRDGYRLLAVEITVENVSGGQTTVNPLYAYLVDSQGFVYQAVLGGVNNQIEVASINPGEKATGWVAFEVPENAVPASLKYSVNASQNATLQVALEK